MVSLQTYLSIYYGTLPCNFCPFSTISFSHVVKIEQLRNSLCSCCNLLVTKIARWSATTTNILAITYYLFTTTPFFVIASSGLPYYIHVTALTMISPALEVGVHAV